MRQLVSDGFAVTAAGVFYHNANLDYDTSDYDTHRDDVDGLITYLRVNLIGGASIPVVIGGGMNNTQLSGRTTNDALFQANLLGAEYRNAGVASYDTINPRCCEYCAKRSIRKSLKLGGLGCLYRFPLRYRQRYDRQ